MDERQILTKHLWSRRRSTDFKFENCNIYFLCLPDWSTFQKLSDHPLAIDAVWFGGGNKDGVYLVISGARRKQRWMKDQVWFGKWKQRWRLPSDLWRQEDAKVNERPGLVWKVSTSWSLAPGESKGEWKNRFGLESGNKDGVYLVICDARRTQR